MPTVKEYSRKLHGFYQSINIQFAEIPVVVHKQNRIGFAKSNLRPPNATQPPWLPRLLLKRSDQNLLFVQPLTKKGLDYLKGG